jgi:hypothetical protein
MAPLGAPADAGAPWVRKEAESRRVRVPCYRWSLCEGPEEGAATVCTPVALVLARATGAPAVEAEGLRHVHAGPGGRKSKHQHHAASRGSRWTSAHAARRGRRATHQHHAASRGGRWTSTSGGGRKMTRQHHATSSSAMSRSEGEIAPPPEVPPLGGTPRAATMSKAETTRSQSEMPMPGQPHCHRCQHQGFTPDAGIGAAGREGEITDPPEVLPVGGTPRAFMMSKAESKRSQSETPMPGLPHCPRCQQKGVNPDAGIGAAGREGEITDPPEVLPVGGTPRAAMMSKGRGQGRCQGAMMPRGDRSSSPESLLSLAKGGGTRPRQRVAKRKQRNCDRVSCRFVRAVR